ncbi:MAG: thioredoxin family protein [Gammaproteobacteria bacterium]|nr:thioredoxin family protein [Gammaproteobacteria bacterium]MCF6361988.1 thioredoxin family protein [Gammaproteobacteria bacterium]
MLLQIRIVVSFLFLVLLLTVSPLLAAETRDPGSHFFDETWGDLVEELETARAEAKKGILIFFELDECPFCHRMKRSVLNQPEVQKYFREHFRIFIIDIEGDVEMVDFQGNATTQKDFAFKANRVRATPVMVFYDLDGKEVMRYTGATSGVEEFLWLGEFIAEAHYKTLRFTKYKRQKARAARQTQ